MGLDSGGTKTEIAVCDQNANLIAFHRVESIAPTMGAKWVPKLDALLTKEATHVKNACSAVLGLPFHGEDAEYTLHQTEIIQDRFGDRGVVENDVRIAFDGALAGTAGVLILAGTGSMAWGSLNGADDPHFRVGGWGDLIGDEGSAFWIGRHSLQIVSRHLDGRENSSEFSGHILDHLGINPLELHSWIGGMEEPRKSIASIAKATGDLAQSGNEIAQRILSQAAEQLAEHVHVTWRMAGGVKPLAWSYAGGVFKSSYMLELLETRLGCAPLKPCLPPIGGALLRAAQNAGWSVDAAWVSKLASSLEEKMNT
jgi:N-acetylglucosamine kinase